ncbi:thioesterase family protein [uncultured Micrococcus sp.]|uniref:thioesterase family protein n=1 Tax=uncultured Micrococcus sp. TaxID=114051 RepID=UPI0025990381|nr:thioesterase family protein [uncultured Micrococcus sp.]
MTTPQISPREEAVAAEPSAYFVRLGEPVVDDGVRHARVRSTVHAQGAWRAEEMHMAAVSGLLVHEIVQHEPTPQLRIARLSYDILGTLWAGELEVRTRTVRPGRTIELVESELTARGRAVVVARAWRLATTDTAGHAQHTDAPLTPRADCAGQNPLDSWDGGFLRSLRGVAADDHAPGRGRVWLSTDVEMVEGEPTEDLTRLIGLADTANGIAPVLDPAPGGWFFPNVDLQIHLFRAPSGSWLGVSSQVSVGSDGVGLTSSVLHDEAGPFAHAEQTLTVRPWPRG